VPRSRSERYTRRFRIGRRAHGPKSETRLLPGRQAEFGADTGEGVALEHTAGVALVNRGALLRELRVMATLLRFERSRAGAQKILDGGASPGRDLRSCELRNVLGQVGR